MSNIEIQGLAWLEEVVAESNSLEPFFDRNDRTPSWDGFIFAYEEKITKNNLLARIPVQIKSEKVTELDADKTSFSFEIADLKNYLKDGGVILLVVQIITRKEKKVFVSSLLPSDLIDILNSCKPAQKEKSLNLDELDICDLSVLESICRNFIINRDLQYGIRSLPAVRIEDMCDLLLTVDPYAKPLDKFLLSQPQYLYGKKYQDDIVYSFVGKINITKFAQHFNHEITIDSHKYFEKYQVIHKPEENIVQFGNGLSWNLKTNTITISFRGTLAGQINDIEFLTNLSHSQYFQIGDTRFDTHLNDDEFITLLENRRLLLNDVKALMTVFRIDPEKLDLDQIDESGDKLLSVLIDFMVYNKKETKLPIPLGIRLLKIANLSLGVFIYQNENGDFRINDLFGKNDDFLFSISNDEERVIVSPYTILAHDFLLAVDNLNLRAITDSIKGVKYSPIYAEHINLFLLELIHSFDKVKDTAFLDSAMEINYWLMEHGFEKTIFIINQFQMLRRMRELTNEEKLTLISEKESSENRIYCGISILLENKTDFEISFSKLTNEEREIFIKYPLYTLAQNLNLVN